MRSVPVPVILSRLLLALAALFLALAGTAVMAKLPARPDGPILDQAAIIPDQQEAALDRKLRSYNRETGRAIIIVTVTSLDGQVPERYAQDLARAWGIGGAESQEGVLFLIAPYERKVRIQTSVGTQGRLTDGFVGQTIRTVVTPRFKQDDYAGGITDGVDALIAQLERDPVDAKAVAEAADAASAQRSGKGSSAGGMPSVFIWLIVLIVFISFFGRGGRRGGYRRSGIDPGIVLWGISEAMRHGSNSGGWSSGGGSFGSGDGGFGGFGGGGGGFDGGGASGDW
ncbi:YgcG family protein [Novosphingobium sp.]|uniref:TPM domain-containing protein n=1 Tax=Novosphingobium sp. TaxID=1874826 RepID=UPI0025D046BA|nr:TPM domain-containing protein [Novosphingobium sp.]